MLDKKIKIMDLASLLTLVLYIGFIIFIILALVFYYKWNNDQDNVLSKEQNLLVLIVFTVSMCMLTISVVSNISLSFMLLLTDFRNEQANEKKKLYFYLSICLVTLCIPVIIFIKKLNKFKFENNINQIDTKNEKVDNPDNSNKNNDMYFENNQWKYFDGTDHWVMNENNEWVKEDK